MPHQCTTCGRTFEDGSKEMLSGCPDCGGNKFQFKPAGAANGGSGGASAGSEAGGPASAANAATAPKKTPENARTGTADTSEPSATGASETGATAAPETEGDDRASAVNRAAATVRDWVGKRGDDSRDDPASGSTRNDAPARNDPASGSPRHDASSRTDAPNRTDAAAPSAEDSAQASARRDVVSESELPDEPPQRAGSSEAPASADAPATGDSPADGNVVSAPDDESPGLKELREELNSQFESIRIEEPGQYELNLMELYEREEYIISLQEDGKYVIEVPDAWDAGEQ